MHNQPMSSLLPVYARAELAFERGEGAWLIDDAGRRWLDFASGIAVTALGHGHPHLVRAVQEQAAKLWHTSNLFRIPELERLADRLVARTFADTVFVCNSGAEALECAVKMARRYWFGLGKPERHRIIAFDGAFHGRTMTTISATRTAKMVEGFGPLLPGFDIIPFGDHDMLKAAVGPQTAAVLIEPIQGEGGIRVVPEQCLRGLRELCDETGILLILDEIQSGMGRTGRLFDHERAGIRPDIMPVAKALGGGFPIGACLATARAASGMAVGTHGSTFGGNPLACAVANAVLDVMLEDGFMEGVMERGTAFQAGLDDLRRRHPQVIEQVRGRGFLAGLRLVPPARDFAKRLREAGVVAPTASDNVIRLFPPLTLTAEEMAVGLEALDATCRAFAA